MRDITMTLQPCRSSWPWIALPVLFATALLVGSATAWQTTIPDLQNNHHRVARTSRHSPRGIHPILPPQNNNIQFLKQLPMIKTQLAMAVGDDDDAPKKKVKKKRKSKKKTSEVTAKASTSSKTKKKKSSSSTKPSDVVEVVNEPVIVAATTKATTTTVPSTEGDGLILTTTLKEGENKDNIYDGIWYGPLARAPDILDFDLTGGRPGAIIESLEELDKKARIMKEVDQNTRNYPNWMSQDYGFFEEDEAAEYDNDDPDAIDSATLGQYDITDLEAKFDWEWDTEKDPDPNQIENQQYDDLDRPIKYLAETPKDEEGIEIGFDSFFGPSNPIDERTQIGTKDSYMIDEATRDEKMLTPEFFPGDPEIAYNEEVIQHRRSLDIIETYQDEFLPEDMPVPRHVANGTVILKSCATPPRTIPTIDSPRWKS